MASQWIFQAHASKTLESASKSYRRKFSRLSTWTILSLELIGLCYNNVITTDNAITVVVSYRVIQNQGDLAPGYFCATIVHRNVWYLQTGYDDFVQQLRYLKNHGLKNHHDISPTGSKLTRQFIDSASCGETQNVLYLKISLAYYAVAMGFGDKWMDSTFWRRNSLYSVCCDARIDSVDLDRSRKCFYGVTA